MKHAGADYQDSKFLEKKIPKDEPVMLFRAQDKHAAMILRIYAAFVRADGNKEMAKVVEEHARKMELWPVKKAPDLPREGLCRECDKPHAWHVGWFVDDMAARDPCKYADGTHHGDNHGLAAKKP